MECSRGRESLQHAPPTSLPGSSPMCLGNGLPCPFSQPHRMGWQSPLLCPLLHPRLLAHRDGPQGQARQGSPCPGRQGEGLEALLANEGTDK